MHFKILVFNYYFLTNVFENVFVNSFLHTDNDPMLTLTVTLNVCIACRRCSRGVHLYVILATVSSGPAARGVFPQFPDWLTWDNLSELSEMAWSDFFLHISPALRNEIRRSQIDGWLTGVDRHIALTSVKKLRRANRWLSPTVQLFPFADTDCCACKKSRSVKNIHLWRETERERERNRNKKTETKTYSKIGCRRTHVFRGQARRSYLQAAFLSRSYLVQCRM